MFYALNDHLEQLQQLANESFAGQIIVNFLKCLFQYGILPKKLILNEGRCQKYIQTYLSQTYFLTADGRHKIVRDRIPQIAQIEYSFTERWDIADFYGRNSHNFNDEIQETLNGYQAMVRDKNDPTPNATTAEILPLKVELKLSLNEENNSMNSIGSILREENRMKLSPEIPKIEKFIFDFIKVRKFIKI